MKTTMIDKLFLELAQVTTVKLTKQMFDTPPSGKNMLCLVCARIVPWGIFDGDTGVAVCVECRDKARA